MNPQALMAQALDRHGRGDPAGAEQLYRQVLRLAPGHRDATHMLAVACAQQGRRGEAGALFEQVMAANPHDPLALTNYANVLREMGRHEMALDMLDRALAIDPRDPERWNSRAMLLQSLSRFEDAFDSVNQALVLRPGHAGAVRNRADILQSLGCYAEALAAYDRMLQAAPHDAGLWSNRGLSLRNLGQLEASSQSFERAMALNPQIKAPLFHVGLNHLLAGDFARGLPLYELRKDMPQPVEARTYSQPLWTGREDIAGRHLFVYIEQGLGDTIQFFRFIRKVVERGATVTLSVYGPMMRLLKNADPACALIGWGEVPDRFDYHIPLMSLPLALGTTLETVPAPPRYLAAEPERVARWRTRIGDEGFRIGVAWRGNKAVFGAEGKEFPLEALQALSRMPDVRLISLQKDAGPIPDGLALERFDDLDLGGDAFIDSAAAIENLDLVISADSAPAHLAGALGAPVWVALKHVPDWRWLLNRDDSPWYPSMRLFRQTEPGDWASVFREMEKALAQMRPAA
ncbi:MAG TPA: tetratricopeptide repeat-containing glycosyltransferase family protein [Rhizomicrobium sp.]|jgi:tetratricopeptide (TPR) repeat protein